MAQMKHQSYSIEFPTMNSLSLLFLFLYFSLLILLTSDFGSPHKMPRQREVQETISASSASKQFETHFYNQTLDHFNYMPESYEVFVQRYVMSSKYWGGAHENAPIFVYLGRERAIDTDMEENGVLSDNAPHFKALQVYIEHRFYGRSIPFGKLKEAMNNASIRGYFNSAQAIADYAEVIIYLKKKLSAHNSPVIVFGGGYGGMLAAWFRLKYPHVVLGALASSAPILYFDDITQQDGFYSIVTKDFKEVSKSCYKTIQKSWSVIHEVASEPNGLSVLSKKFKTCSPLKNAWELEGYLISMYADAAKYDCSPVYHVAVVCDAIDRAKEGTDNLNRIFEGIVAYAPNKTCYVNEYSIPSESDIGWFWQTCSEMVMPIGRGINATMFSPKPFNLGQYINECESEYGITPRRHWVTNYYGGHDIKLVLQRFGSNIIFSNGLRDPYSSGGVLEDLSDSLHAVKTMNGSHCSDILNAKKTDPQWLINQRKMEFEIIEGWLIEYYKALAK